MEEKIGVLEGGGWWLYYYASATNFKMMGAADFHSNAPLNDKQFDHICKWYKET
jgi:hypothetical protein